MASLATAARSHGAQTPARPLHVSCQPCTRLLHAAGKHSSKHVCRTATPSSTSSSASPAAPKQRPGRTPAPTPGPAQERHGYAWTKQWYPVAVEASLDPAVPHKVTLMGYDLVLCKEPGTEGRWSCLDNACPHRAAPLSQDSLDATTGCLRCNYHGWSFDSSGHCTDIPQSSTPENMCSIMATAARAHPLQLRQGLIWVWPEAGPQAAAEAAATPATLAPELEDPSWISYYGWLWREVPVSIDYGIENALDSAHAPWAHNNCLGVSMNDARKDAALKVTKYDPAWGVEHVCELPLTAGLLADCRQIHTFEAPGLFHVKNDQGKGALEGTELKLVVYRTPVSAGVSTAFYNNVRRAVSPEGEAKLAVLHARMKSAQRFREGATTLQTHMNMLRFFDADLVLVHEQERLVQDKGGWQAAYCMPHGSDAGVLAMRRWWDAAGPVPYKGGHTLGSILPRERVLDHYNSHVLRCPDCQEGLRDLRHKQAAAQVASIALAVPSLAISAAYVGSLILRSVPAAGIASKAAAVAASSAPVSGGLKFVADALSAAAAGTGPLWWLMPASAAALAVAACWLYFKVHRGLKAWEQENVFFRDYDLRYPDHTPPERP